MARSIKKGPYVVDSLVRKIETLNRSGEKRVLKTWARRCTVLPEFVGHTLAVHNGNKFIPIYVTENMVGQKLGEFVPTRSSGAIRRRRRPSRPPEPERPEPWKPKPSSATCASRRAS